MATNKIEPSRIVLLNADQPRSGGDYALYWMQQSQRAVHNPALEFAVQQANKFDQFLLVAFGLMDNYPEASSRHYRFMLEGLAEVAKALARRRIKFVVRHGDPSEVAIQLAQRATLVVCDRGYLRHQKEWRTRVARKAGCSVFQVEGDVVVPVNEVSDKREYAARTIRPKINRQLAQYLVNLKTTAIARNSLSLDVAGIDISDPDSVLTGLNLDRSLPRTRMFQGGSRMAQQIMQQFLAQNFATYAENRNRPETDDVSHMSKYLHFGQISPVWLALQVCNTRQGLEENIASYLEELIIRREVAQNFCEFEPHYDSYECLPSWARQTLEEHRADHRPARYTRSQMEDAQTHDEYWNAAMREMRYTGYMHNYMRMYWGKKILEWCNTPTVAYRTLLELNNKYFIDGRDPNSFAGVAWIFGNHDRAWQERAIFGKIRYMAASGLERKCNISDYVDKVNRLVQQVKTEQKCR